MIAQVTSVSVFAVQRGRATVSTRVSGAAGEVTVILTVPEAMSTWRTDGAQPRRDAAGAVAAAAAGQRDDPGDQGGLVRRHPGGAVDITRALLNGQPEDSALREFFGDQTRRLLARAGPIAPGSLDEARALASPVDFDDTPWALRGPAPEFGPSMRRPVCSRRAACEWGRSTPPREG